MLWYARKDRVYIEKGNMTKLSDVKYFTFEPHIAFPDSSVQEKNGLVENNLIAFPINLDGDCVGVVELWDKSDDSDFSDDDLDMVLLLGGQAKEVYRQAVMFRQRESNYSYLYDNGVLQR